MILEIIKGEDITKAVFVKQRLRNSITNTFEDKFVAVCTPAQLEDLEENAPADGTSFYRVSKIDVISRNPDYLQDVFDDILVQIRKLCDDVESLNELEVEELYEIESDHIDVTMSLSHIHYRIPLFATPCGLNEIYTDLGDDKHRVGSQDIDLQGWLNTTISDPSGYKFKYNIDTDLTLRALWPIDASKLSYASLEANGITQVNNVLINENGIFWRKDLLGEAPWPQDWAGTGSPGSEEYQVSLVLDFIK